MSRTTRTTMLALLLFAVPTSAQEVPPAPAPKSATGRWAEALKEHPRPLGSRSFLASLAQSKPTVYKEIQRDKELLLSRCITHAVDGLGRDQAGPLVAAVMKNVEKGTTNLHQDTWIALGDAALTFDGFHDMIGPDDRRKIIDWMNAHLEKYTSDQNAFHNSTLSKILTYLRVAYATWGENPRAKEFRDYAIEKICRGKVVPVLKQFERGRIIAYENQTAFLYVAGDCTKAYAASNLSSWTRQIVFLRPATFAILDRVVSTRPEYAKTWLLHCRNEPQIEATTTTISDGKGTLTAVTLLPAKPVIRKVEGYQYDGKIVGARVGAAEVVFEVSGQKVGGTVTPAGKKSPLAQELKKGKHE